MISPSQFFAGVMEERIGVSSEVVPNGIDLDGYKVGSGENRIGYFARMYHFKGLTLLVDAFIYLRTELGDKKTKLAVAGTMGGGDEEYVAGLKKKLAEHGLEDQVTWHANVSREEKAEFLESLSVFSVPAIYPEGFGLYLVEAMACGVPVVMPRASSFTEIVGPAECGVLVEPENPEDLAKGLQTVLEDEGLRKSMGEKGRLAVEDRYHVGAMAKSFEEILRKVVEK